MSIGLGHGFARSISRNGRAGSGVAVSSWLGAHLRLEDEIVDGDEAEVWAASAGVDRYVVHVSPSSATTRTSNLVSSRFELFIDAYRRAAGHLPAWEYDLIPDGARIRLRDNIRLALAHGASLDDEYQQRQVEAF